MTSNVNDIQSIKNDISTMKGDITNLQATVGGLQADMKTLQKYIEDFKELKSSFEGVYDYLLKINKAGRKVAETLRANEEDDSY
ncbi:hypothetical protein TVAG_168760 [Trichomonas vaginalis G3]|uniref:Uncharacterized protein n=1 Tax=Trichomonas vaginalis (strain ATCC PRA-98 / G3) TaxID=412133 RepID=A2FHF0_TRIV3|nr:hypothetical protein TVAGG3_0451230 [Trichomonas vaginalis G3]EAX95667.1 hypothetical protein TVAG_168760 [Trichomonas vaginalis G3]KAI5538169.1 hypothetical protein TVAGG3_0451230 [Trichomonas vaginalis G3]|eukprot:XP_001308597.1 hypothetical protein [Trichomonas vaginalis G3]